MTQSVFQDIRDDVEKEMGVVREGVRMSKERKTMNDEVTPHGIPYNEKPLNNADHVSYAGTDNDPPMEEEQWRMRPDVNLNLSVSTNQTYTKQDILEEAITTVVGRGVSYDAPEDNFQRIARLWNAHLLNRFGASPGLTPQDVSMMMVLMKTARLEFNPVHHDSWVDIAGYAACGGELAAKERVK